MRLVGHGACHPTGHSDQSCTGTGTPCRIAVCKQFVLPFRNHFRPIPGYPHDIGGQQGIQEGECLWESSEYLSSRPLFISRFP